ncbi:MAG: antibiotic biosynthesis monooxygenase, partial [Myxococcota bacterium]|nr:antibiotic biosynthesis monooxygenase [Myxococcota bacterium]
MIVAISRFAIKNGTQASVRAAFENRPRAVEATPGFIAMEVFQQDATFVLLTRWTDEMTFRAWHAGPAHHDSHAMIPKGIKLDPSQTMLLVAERIAGATSGSAAGDLVNDGFLPIAQIVRDGGSLHAVAVDGTGHVTRANSAMCRAVGRDITGLRFADLLAGESNRMLTEHLRLGGEEPVMLQIRTVDEQFVSLSARARSAPPGFVVIAEPRWDDHRALEATLMTMNAELAQLSRENARQARALEDANRSLRDAHWHLEKIAQVLPICLSCRSVKSSEGTWEEAANFLLRHADFLSHAYCPPVPRNIARVSRRNRDRSGPSHGVRTRTPRRRRCPPRDQRRAERQLHLPAGDNYIAPFLRRPRRSAACSSLRWRGRPRATSER